MDEMLNLVGRMDPHEAVAEIARALKMLFAVLDEEVRTQFLLNLIGEAEGDKVSSLVHL
jgi:hypothetical protein